MTLNANAGDIKSGSASEKKNVDAWEEHKQSKHGGSCPLVERTRRRPLQ